MPADAPDREAASTFRPVAEGMEGHLNVYYPVLDHGFIAVKDYMGDDLSILQMARMSYGRGTKGVGDDRALLRYLMRHLHTSPFEGCVIKLHVKLPIFVMRQWVRHRTASLNEYSARYSVMPDEFYLPEPAAIWRCSPPTTSRGAALLDARPGRRGAAACCGEDAQRAFASYHRLLNADEDGKAVDPEGVGIARELARIGLPLSTYTQMYWQTNLHNLMHFLRLRADPHAQWEIRVYAEKILEIMADWVPLTREAFRDYQLEAVRFPDGDGPGQGHAGRTGDAGRRRTLRPDQTRGPRVRRADRVGEGGGNRPAYLFVTGSPARMGDTHGRLKLQETIVMRRLLSVAVVALAAVAAGRRPCRRLGGDRPGGDAGFRRRPRRRHRRSRRAGAPGHVAQHRRRHRQGRRHRHPFPRRVARPLRRGRHARPPRQPRHREDGDRPHLQAGEHLDRGAGGGRRAQHPRHPHPEIACRRRPPPPWSWAAPAPGKSAWAEALLAGGPALYLATGQALDGEMAERIRLHRARRGALWSTVEEPLELAAALDRLAEPGRPVLVDCLTLWLSNLMHAGRDVAAECAALCEVLTDPPGPVVLVSNEVGLGLVPDNALGRAFRDHQGRINQAVAAICRRVVFVAAGLPLHPQGPAMTRRFRKIPATIVTGFLGAGKTTLVRHVLANAGGRRLALIVNEFGDVGIDGEMLKGCGDAGCPRRQHRRAGQRLPVLHRRRRVPAGDRGPAGAAGRSSTSSSRPRAWRCPSRWSRRSTGRRSAPSVTVDGVVAVVDGAARRRRPLRRRSDALARSAPPIPRSTTTIRSRRCSRTSSPAPTGAAQQGRPDGCRARWRPGRRL